MRKSIIALAQLLAEFDTSAEERKKTGEVARRIFRPSNGWVCAICGCPQRIPRRVVAAHIRSLEEGGDTDDAGNNLIPLCDGRDISAPLSAVLARFSQNLQLNKATSTSQTLATALDLSEIGLTAQLGCHQLYDGGLIARATIREIKRSGASWGNHKDLRDKTLALPLHNFEIEFEPGTNRKRKFEIAIQRARSHLEINEQWIRDVCNVVTIARRTSSQRFFFTAEKYAKQLEDCLLRDKKIGSGNDRSRAYYELALLRMVQWPNPDLQKTIHLLEQSCHEAKGSNNPIALAMSKLEWIHANIFITRHLTKEMYNNFLRNQQQCIGVLSDGKEQNTAHTIRWKMNGLIHQAQLHIKMGQTESAAMSAREAWQLREQLDFSNGWSAFQGIHLNTIDGMVLALQGEYIPALKALARALVPMRAVRGKRPEGYKDLADCAAWSLARMAHGSAQKVSEIAQGMIDGRSGCWPTPSTHNKYI